MLTKTRILSSLTLGLLIFSGNIARSEGSNVESDPTESLVARPPDRDRHRDRNRYDVHVLTTECASSGYRFNRCRVGGHIRDVSLRRRVSDAPCRGNWGYDNDSIWVSNGCRAVFEVTVAGRR